MVDVPLPMAGEHDERIGPTLVVSDGCYRTTSAVAAAPLMGDQGHKDIIVDCNDSTHVSPPVG